MQNLKISIGVFTLILLNFAVASQAQTKAAHPANGIQFTGGAWSEVVKKAQSGHKYIFVDAYASWCGPCKQLKNTTFKNGKVADLFNRNFINFSIDTEKGQGVQLAEKWGLVSYPTLYFFDPDGKLISANEGFVNATELLGMGQRILSQK